jgi:hypothetical protein
MTFSRRFRGMLWNVLASFPFVVSAAAVSLGQTEPQDVGSRKSAAGKTVCEIRQHTGRPTLFINGTARFPMAFASYHPAQSRYEQFGKHGVHVYFPCLTLSEKWLNWGTRRVVHHTPAIWTGADTIDFAVVEKAIREIVEADPDAVIIPRIYCESPSWWDKLHPEEVQNVGEGLPLRQSYTSLHWRGDVVDVLRKIVRSVSSSQYANRVIGYMPTTGHTEEYAGAEDLSPCADRSFRDYTWERYAQDKNAITRVFGSKLEAISVPTGAERQRADLGDFLDPENSQRIIDYRQFVSDRMADIAIALCKAVKEESDGRLVAGVFFGYTRILPDSGHLALRKVLDSGVVDFVSTPYSGMGNSRQDIGAFDYRTFTEVDSVQRAGRLFYAETDIRTSLSRFISETRPEFDPDGEYKQPTWIGPPTIEDSLQVLKTVFAKVLISGSANWWFDLWGGWYDNERILSLFAQMQKIGDESLDRPRRSIAQIAVLLDENSYRYRPFAAAQHGGRLSWIDGQLAELGKVGAPYDLYLLDDVKDLELSQYRMVIFLNAFVLSEDQRRIIADRCMSENRLLVWMYAPGLIKDKLSIDNVSSLLDMKLQIDAAHPASTIALNLAGATIAYEGAAVSPFLYVREGADAVCGRTPDGRIVVAERAGPKCRHVFVAMPPLPWKALQHYAKEAKVHLYNENGIVVWANESYLAVSAAETRTLTIRVPKKAVLTELLPFGKREQFGMNTNFDISIPANSCRLFQTLR